MSLESAAALLCPFAAAPLRAGRVRLQLSDATSEEALAADLAEELRRLDRQPRERVETTILIHPNVLGRFDDYNRFLDVGDLLIESLGLRGVVQVVGFHPEYRFAGAAPDDPANATNRSPYPMLHLLREEGVAEAVASHPDPEGIPRRNAERLRLRARRRA